MRKALGFIVLFVVVALVGAVLNASASRDVVFQPGDEEIILSDMPLKGAS